MKLKKAFSIPYTFVLLNWAAVAGLFHFALGHKNVWVPSAGAPGFGLTARRQGER